MDSDYVIIANLSSRFDEISLFYETFLTSFFSESRFRIVKVYMGVLTYETRYIISIPYISMQDKLLR
jgi:hypothetical protein